MQDSVTEGFRLSPQQERLWPIQQDNTAYRAQCGILLEGELNTDALREALQKVISRHEILRTIYHRQSGLSIPFQVITENDAPDWSERDLAGKDSSQQESEIEKIFRQDKQKLFDLERAPLLHSILARLSEQQHILIVSLPALCADVWTLRNLVDEIGNTYAACLRDVDLSDEPMQYVDFSEWQNELLEGEEANAGRAYWVKHGLNSIPDVRLPFQLKSDSEEMFEPKSQALTIPSDLLAKLEAAAHKCETSVEIFLLACWQTVLWRLTAEPSIVVAKLFDGRSHEEIHVAFGLFAKWLPVACGFQENSDFREILRQVDQASREASRWQDYFTTSEVHNAGGDALKPAFIPIAFEYDSHGGKSRIEGVSFSTIKLYSCFERFAIKLSCTRTSDSLTLELHYDRASFAERDIERLGEHVLRFLESAVDNPGSPIGKLEMLNDAQRHQLLIGFNDTAVEYPVDKCIHELFEQQAALTPDKTALVFEQDRLTYAELNAKANRLAHHLRGLGVAPDARVGVLLDRSLEMIVSVLGILKAGGAYVPLDPIQPKHRLALILEDAQPTLVLTQEQFVEALPDQSAHAVCLDTCEPVIAENSDLNLSGAATTKNLAYVLFTSGSTGRPKGVAIEHRQLLNYVLSIQERLDLSDCASFATVSTFAADLGNTVIFPSLCAGGTLHVISQQRISDANALAEYFSHHSIDCMKIVPSHLGALLACSRPEQVLPRKRLVLGGDVSRRDWVEKLQKLAPDCVIFNHYGPTEATVGVLTYRLAEREQVYDSFALPLGRPISNTEIYILDRNLQPVPVWVQGELHIGGDNLARGYFNRADLTAEKFIPNPFSLKPGTRLYKTGDLARYMPDGNVEFFGRADHQVKIRGFRIEPGEIEIALLKHPAVLEAVVIAREDIPGDKRIVAYVVSKQRTATGELRHFLLESLPDYMVPAAFVILDNIPLTPNGKVDRRALPLPEHVNHGEQAVFIAPRSYVEEVIADIWAEVLMLEKVSIDENFFELGGHSLLVMQVISRLRSTFQVELPPRALFEATTVADLSEVIIAKEAKAGQSEKIARNFKSVKSLSDEEAGEILYKGRLGAGPTGSKPEETQDANGLSAVKRELLEHLLLREGVELFQSISRRETGDNLPLSFAQQRLWFLHQLEPDGFAYNLPRAFRLSGLLNLAALEQALNEIIRRHESLRTTFDNAQGEPVQIINPPQPLEMPVLDLSALSEAEREARVQQLAYEEARRPFDLARGPMLRINLLRLSEQEYVVLFTMHHIISDGWSIRVLVREMVTLYTAYHAQLPSPLPDLPIQYADFACWQRQWMQGDVLDAQLSYWKQQLAGAPRVLALPTDRPAPADRRFTGATQSVMLSASLAESLNALSRRNGVTLFMTLLAAFNTLLYRLTRQEDIVIGTGIAGRNRGELEELIGFFVNMLVLRTDMSGNPTFLELLKRVREVTLGAYAHQDLPFERLVEELQPERGLSSTPLFQAVFDLQNASPVTLELPGLTLSPLQAATDTAHFDLIMSMAETQQGLIAALEYNGDLFDASTITRMLNYFEILLEAILAHPEQQLLDIPLSDRQDHDAFEDTLTDGDEQFAF